MPLLSNMQVPPPANWQEFETLCCDLWRAIWKDPNAQQNGRLGQTQHGVDVSGRINQADKWAGVQCKGKDNYADKILTKDEVRGEVAKAKKFKPRLSEYIIATTGLKDAKIEELSREITEIHLKSNLFSVHIWSWVDIVIRIADFPEVIEKHYPGLSVNTTSLKTGIDEIKESTQAILEGNAEVKSSIASLSKEFSSSSKYNYVSISTEILTSEYQAELDYARDLLNSRKPKAALEALEKQKSRIWPTATPIVKFRLITNIGAAKLSLNQEQEAAYLFLEALQYNPEDEKALSNAGLGHLLLGQLDEARRYAFKILDKNAANRNAYSLIVQTSINQELNDVIEKIPEPFRKTPDVAHAIGHKARKEGDLLAAQEWFRTAVDNDTENNPDLKGALGSTILESVTAEPSLLLTKQLADELKEKIKYAIQLLSSAWGQYAGTDLHNLRLHWVANRAVAKRILGDLDSAIKDSETALDGEPTNPVFIKHGALLAFESKDSKKAIDLLKKIQDATETPEAPLLLAQILREENRSFEAIQIINDLLKNRPDYPDQQEAKRLLIELYIDSKDTKSASEISGAMRAAKPTDVLNLVDAAKIAKCSGNSVAAVSLLKESIKSVTDETTFREKFILANELYFIDQFEDAARILKTITVRHVDSPLTRRLLYSYYRSGNWGQALEICQVLRVKNGPLKYVSEIESVIYEEIGDLDNALKVCQEYLAVFSDDFSMKLRNAVVNLRRGKLSEVDVFLNSSIDIKSLSLEAGLQVALLHANRKSIKKAFEIMYELRRTYFNLGMTHVKYIGFFFAREKEVNSWLDVSVVDVDSTVCIADESGRQEWYTVENRKDADIQRKELNMEHPLAKKIVGKSVGDEIVLKESVLSKEIGKVIEIKSKYVFALHESMSLHEKLFPETPGIWEVKMGVSEKEGELPKGFQTIFNEVSRQHEVHLKIEGFYKEGKLTVGAFAKLIGRSVIDTWGSMTVKPDLGIKCCNGDVGERTNAASFLAMKPKLIIDIISLMTAYGIDAGDVIVKTFGKLGVSQSTVDLINNTIAERKGMPSDGFMILGKEGDQLVRQEISAEQVKAGIEYLEKILGWVETNCDIIPCKAALRIKREEKQKIEELLGDDFVDTVLIASEPGNVLYSDDQRLRGFAENEFGVHGVWTQVVLMDCVGANSLEIDKYNEMVVKLAASHYHHTSIDPSILIEAAKQSKWVPSSPYTTVLQILNGKSSDEASAVIVATNFLFELWKIPILSEQRDYLIFALLDALTAGRNRRILLAKLNLNVKKRFILLPIAEKQIMSLIDIWKRLNIV